MNHKSWDFFSCLLRTTQEIGIEEPMELGIARRFLFDTGLICRPTSSKVSVELLHWQHDDQTVLD